jgi:hypothetical protein
VERDALDGAGEVLEGLRGHARILLQHGRWAVAKWRLALNVIELWCDNQSRFDRSDQRHDGGFDAFEELRPMAPSCY